MDNSVALYKCNLYMPHLTPYAGKPFCGRSSSDQKAAKQKAALLACKALFDDGLLEHDLLPKKRKFIDIDDIECIDDKRRGTKNVKDYYKVSLVKELSCYKKGHLFHLYRIDSVLTKAAKNTKNTPHRPENYNERIGIIVNQKLPSIAMSKNTYYTLSGEVSASLCYCGEIKLTKEFDEDVSKFQLYTWKKVIGCVTPWMKYDTEGNGLIVVPLNSKNELDYKALKDISNDIKFGRTRLENESLVYDSRNYENVVITPNHKVPEEHYFVEDVMRETNPYTVIDEESRETFKEYYKRKYNLEVTISNQHLLRVSGADHRHFMYIPIASKQASKSRLILRDQKFLPEFVYIEPLKASLWRQLQMLPFILNRVSSLIALENLRSDIVRKNPMFYKIENRENEYNEPTFNYLISQAQNQKHQVPCAHDLLKAFTLAGAGENFNMERLETLGDVFLKYFVGVRMFCDSITNLLAEEGMLSKERSKIVGNRRLFQTAIQNKFFEYINARKLEPYYNFMPPSFNQEENLEETIIEMDKQFCSSNNAFSQDSESNPNVNENTARKNNLKSKSIVELLTKDDINNLSNSGMAKDIQNDLLMKALANQNDEAFSTDRITRFCLRQFVRIGDKYLADVIEAAIGLFLERGGQGAALQFMNYLQLNSHGTLNESDFPTNSFLPHAVDNIHIEEETKRKMTSLLAQIDYEEIERKLNYKFNEKSFLLQALTHASYGGNRITASYERLEFLGDGILDYIITCFLYTNGGNKTKTPGEITELRSALVQNNAFASIVVQHGLEKHLLHESPGLLHKINQCRDQMLKQSSSHYGKGQSDSENFPKLRGEELLQHIKLINEEDCPELINIEVPKVLGDILESVIGAIYIDSKMNLDTVWKVYTHLFSIDQIQNVINEQPKHPVKELMEKFPGKVKFQNPTTHKDTVSVVVKILITQGTVQESLKFKGIGRNGISAKYAAAKCCLREFEKNTYRSLRLKTDSSKPITASSMSWTPGSINTITITESAAKEKFDDDVLKSGTEIFYRSDPVFSAMKKQCTMKSPGSMEWSDSKSIDSSSSDKLEPVDFEMKYGTKNPISTLQEKCSMHGWQLPKYEMVSMNGPSHMPRFKFEVKVKNRIFKDPHDASTKQKAKAQVARLALENMENIGLQ